jgi:hypothetical protein
MFGKSTSSSRLAIEFGLTAVSITDTENSTFWDTTWPGGKIDLSETRAVASWLREAFEGMHVPTAVTATILIPRSAGCIHYIEVPQVSDADLPALVELELETILGEEFDQHEWDFVSLEVAPERKQRLAVVFSVPKPYMDNLRAVLDTVGVRTKHISLTESAFASQLDSPKTLSNVIVVDGEKVELLISSQHTLLQSQSLVIDPTQPCQFEMLLGRLRRLNASLPQSIQAADETRCRLLINDLVQATPSAKSIHTKSLTEAAQEAGIDLVTFQRSELFENMTRERTLAFDLANPKKPPAVGISGRTKLLGLAATALLVTMIYWGYLQSVSSRVAEQVETARQALADYEKQLSGLSQRMEAAQEFQIWQDTNVRWDSQIRTISKHFAESKDLYVVRLQMDNRTQKQRDPVTRIEGRATSPGTVLALTRDLMRENPLLSIQPNGIEPNRVDPKFGSQFRVEITETKEAPVVSIDTPEEA